MSDFKARHVIEALRSGVPSRAVGEYFSEARPAMMRRISNLLDAVREDGHSEGMIYKGRYGEGKTHLLNTVFGMASSSNMVVSLLSLGKETPIDKPYLLYGKLIANTYLPGAKQPGFRQKLEELTPNSNVTGDLLGYTGKEMETDRLYFLLKALLGTQDEEERAILLADLEGDFTTDAMIKKSYRRVSGNVAKFSQGFSKRKHGMEYFYFMSHLFRKLGYDGWVILFDEAELIGRLGKKTRAKCYVEMQNFLRPLSRLEQTLSLFAFSSSYAEDVIDKKHEFSNVEETYADDPRMREAGLSSLNAILDAPELAPLTKAEICQILGRIQEFHGKAYDWEPGLSEETLYGATNSGGYLLRTKIRAAIELFDQLYQYGEAGEIHVSELGKESFEEDEVPELPDFQS